MKDTTWYQIIDIDGTPTNGKPGKGDVETTWKNVKTLLPDNLNGKRILDLGCNAGMYCVNSILMGAKEAVGIESVEKYYKQALFIKEHMARKHNMKMNIKYIHGKTEDHIKDLDKFDIIFAFSILYHISTAHIDKVCRSMADSTNNIIARFRNDNDIKRFSKIFEVYGFKVNKQFEEVDVFEGEKKKKYLVQYIK